MTFLTAFAGGLLGALCGALVLRRVERALTIRGLTRQWLAALEAEKRRSSRVLP